MHMHAHALHACMLEKKVASWIAQGGGPRHRPSQRNAGSRVAKANHNSGGWDGNASKNRITKATKVKSEWAGHTKVQASKMRASNLSSTGATKIQRIGGTYLILEGPIRIIRRYNLL